MLGILSSIEVFKQKQEEKKQTENKLKKSLFEAEVKKLLSQIACIDTWFEMEEDKDLVESCIYQQESLKARYRYLLKRAKEEDFVIHPFENVV